MRNHELTKNVLGLTSCFEPNQHVVTYVSKKRGSFRERRLQRGGAGEISISKCEGALCRVIVGTVDVRRASVVGPATNPSVTPNPPNFSLLLPRYSSSLPNFYLLPPNSCTTRRQPSPYHPAPQRDGREPDSRRPPTQNLRVGGCGVHRRRRWMEMAGA
jgi:hypothetical protein